MSSVIERLPRRAPIQIQSGSSSRSLKYLSGLAMLIAALVTVMPISMAHGRAVSVKRGKQPSSKPKTQPEMALQLASEIDYSLFSPRGETLATYDDASGISFWDAQTRALRRTIADPEIRQLPVFTPDGKSIISVWYNGDTQVRDVVSGQMQRLFTDFDENASVGTNGVLLAGSQAETVKIYNIRTGKLVRSLAEKGESFYFSPDSKRLAVADYEANAVNTVRVWDIASGKRLCITGGPARKETMSLSSVAGKRRDAVSPVLFSLDGKSFVTGGIDPDWQIPQGSYGDGGSPVDYAAKIWDTRTGKLRRVLKGWTTFSRPYAPLAFSKDGQNLVCGGDKRVDIWNLPTNKKLMSTLCTEEPVISTNRQIVAFISRETGDYNVEVHAFKDGKLLRKFSIGKKDGPLALSPDNRFVVVGKNEPFSLTWWDWRTGRLHSSLEAAQRYGPTSSIAFSPDGTALGSHYDNPQDGKACLWDVRSGQLISATEGGGAYARVQFAADGHTLSLLKYSGKEPVKQFGKPNDWELLSPDGKRAAVATRSVGPNDQDEFLSLYDVESKQLLWKRKSGKGTTIGGMEFSPDNKTLATSQPNDRLDSNANFSLWDTATGKVRHVLNGKNGAATFTFSGDGRSVANTTADDRIQIWDVWLGRLKASFQRSGGSVAQLALSPDGTRLASTNYQGDIFLYDAKNGKVLLRWLALVAGERREPNWLAITPAGYYLASSGAEKYIRWRAGNQLFPVEKYRAALRRPDIINRILRVN